MMAPPTRLGVLLVISLLVLPEAVAFEPEARRRVAVVNFAATGSQHDAPRGEDTATVTVLSPTPAESRDAWLSKAIAGLLIQTLSEVRALEILERERMQTFLDEVELGESALFAEERALRIGRVAQVDQVVFGNYQKQNGRIAITLFLLELETQQVLASEQVSGTVEQLRALVHKLVLRLLRRQDTELSDSEVERLRFEATDSITATEHFYRAIDRFDRGDPAGAFGECLQATKQDPQYLEARLWLGRLFEALGHDAHAALAYRNLYSSFPRRVEGLDALVLAGRLLEDQLARPEEAIDVYRELSASKPVTPHALEGSFHLGRLLAERGNLTEAYRELARVDAFRQKALQDPSLLRRSPLRSSTLIRWTRILSLYRESAVQLISLYARLARTGATNELPRPPRGLLVLDRETASFRERQFGRTEALFPDDHKNSSWHRGDWREKFYVLLAPPGCVISGVDMEVTGVLHKQRPYHSFSMKALPFPLPRDYNDKWLGAIFGQTATPQTLRKSVSFHGEHYRLVAIHFVENQSRIDAWSVKVHLLPERSLPQSFRPSGLGTAIDRFAERLYRGFSSRAQESGAAWEGQPLARITTPQRGTAGALRTTAQAYYQPKKDLDVLRVPGSGFFLVTSHGEFDGTPTDLWFAKSSQGDRWSELERLPVNSASQDYSPRLIRSEDDRVNLAWISTRRGKGWELWLSRLEKDLWANAWRVPLEHFADSGMEVRLRNLRETLEYDLHQNRRGEWLLAYYSYLERAFVLLRSRDALHWSELARIASLEVGHGPALVEDSSGVYRLGFLGHGGQLHLWSSNDSVTWRQRRFRVQFWNQSHFATPTTHRMRLFPLAASELLMTVSDNEYGLQYARFAADTGEPLLDLVTRAGLGAYGITQGSEDDYVVAIKEEERIAIRRYRNFNIRGQAVTKDTRNFPIYNETELDKKGNTWRRIFSQARSRVSDVTSLGLDTSGRLWWGIESGIMYKDGEQFIATDVSRGFFHHFVTHITGTNDGGVWFSSSFLGRPEVGFVRDPSLRRPSFQRRAVPKAAGSITATTSALDGSRLYLGTSQGKVIGWDGASVFFQMFVPSGAAVTALAFDDDPKTLWVGTAGDGLFRLIEVSKKQFDIKRGFEGRRILALAAAADDKLWVATAGLGLSLCVPPDAWKHFRPETSAILYRDIGALAVDRRGGVWYLPHDTVPSVGLGYFDGKKSEVYNPPHALLTKPSSLAVEDDGTVWIGTWFDGLYRLERGRDR